MGGPSDIMPRKAPKFQPIGTEEYKKKPSNLPLDIQIKKWCGHNKLVVAAGAFVVIGYILGSIFGRTRVASNFASGQGFDFDSSTDYKLPKRLSIFETLSRGSKQYAFNVMKGTIPFSDDGKEATVQAFDFSYTETKVTSSNKRVARAEKVHELTAMLFKPRTWPSSPCLCLLARWFWMLTSGPHRRKRTRMLKM